MVFGFFSFFLFFFSRRCLQGREKGKAEKVELVAACKRQVSDTERTRGGKSRGKREKQKDRFGELVCSNSISF